MRVWMLVLLAAGCIHSLPKERQSGHRLRAAYLVGPEGLRIPWDWWDTKLSAPCQFRERSDHSFACIPKGFQFDPRLSVFLDAACTKWGANGGPSCANDPETTYDWVIASDDNGDMRVFSATQAPHAMPMFGIDHGQTECKPAGTFPKGGFQLGPELNSKKLARAKQVRAGQGRLQRLLLQTSDGAIELTEDVWDAELETQCIPGTAADGVLRCLPVTNHRAVYADSNCRERIAVLSPSEPSPRYAVDDEDHGHSRYFATMGRERVSEVYSQSDRGCKKSSSSSRVLSLREVLPTRFASLSRKIQGEGRIREVLLVDGWGRTVFRLNWNDARLAADVYPERNGQSWLLVPSGRLGFYSDAQCSQSVVRVQLGEAAPPLIAMQGRDAQRCQTLELHRLGPQVSPPQVWARDCIGCQAAPPAPGYQYAPVGETAQSSEVVRLTLSYE